MAYNGSGLFTNPYNWNNDKTNSVRITASRMQTQDDGIATGLSNAVCKDGQQTCTALVPFAVGISTVAGSVGAPGVAVIGDLTTGIYQSASGAVDITASGTRVGGFTSAGLVNTAVSATTLAASSNFTINTNKFTVNASTGNTVVAGTLAVTGNTTHTGTIILNGSASGSATLRVKATAGSTTFQLPVGNGANGQILTTNGSGVTAWTSASTAIAGAMTLLATVNASAAASVTFNSTYITSTYNKYIIHADSLRSASNAATISLTFSTDNGSSYLSSNYKWILADAAGSSMAVTSSSSASNIPLSGASLNTTTMGQQLVITLQPGASSSPAFCPSVIFDSFFANTNSTHGSGMNTTTTSVNNIKFAIAGDTISGNFHLYGMSGT